MLEKLLAALEALTEALNNAVAAQTGGQAEETTEKPAKPARGKKKAAPADDEVTLEDVRAVLKTLIDGGHNDVVKALLKKFKAAKLGDVSEDNYAALKEAAEAKVAELEEGGDDDLV